MGYSLQINISETDPKNGELLCYSTAVRAGIKGYN